MAEFTIFPDYRRKHYALDAAKMILKDRPRKWEIKYKEKSYVGKKLWNTVAAPYDPEALHLSEKETVLVFEVSEVFLWRLHNKKLMQLKRNS